MYTSVLYAHTIRRYCTEWQYQPEGGGQLSEFTLLLQVRQRAFTRKLYVAPATRCHICPKMTVLNLPRLQTMEGIEKECQAPRGVTPVIRPYDQCQLGQQRKDSYANSKNAHYTSSDIGHKALCPISKLIEALEMWCGEHTVSIQSCIANIRSSSHTW